MSTALVPDTDAAARARAWRLATLAESCDVAEAWEHGAIYRATRYPSVYDLNVVRVEAPAALDAARLEAIADDALAGLDHRLLEFTDAAAAEPVRSELERRGWRSLRLVWMRHAGGLPPDAAKLPVEELPYDAVHDLRVRWHREDFPGIDRSAFHRQAREVALRRRARVLAARENGVTVAFAQLERHADDAEISEVYVRRDHRERGLGTAVTRAAIGAAGGARELWVAADDEGRAWRLYERLGFRAVAKTMQFLRLCG
jgi:GNAT superfamily N-acetyltransferase